MISKLVGFNFKQTKSKNSSYVLHLLRYEGEVGFLIYAKILKDLRKLAYFCKVVQMKKINVD